jgi:hypothetical protein
VKKKCANELQNEVCAKVEAVKGRRRSGNRHCEGWAYALIEDHLTWVTAGLGLHPGAYALDADAPVYSGAPPSV